MRNEIEAVGLCKEPERDLKSSSSAMETSEGDCGRCTLGYISTSTCVSNSDNTLVSGLRSHRVDQDCECICKTRNISRKSKMKSITHHKYHLDAGYLRNKLDTLSTASGLLGNREACRYTYSQYYNGLYRQLINLSSSFVFCSIVFVMLALPLSAMGQSTQPNFLKTPSNISQVVGGNVTLECQIANLGSRLIYWTQIRAGSPRLLYVGHQALQEDSRYVPLFSSTGFNLLLTDLQTSDDAQYDCAVQNSALLASATVTVLVLPGEPIITLNKGDDELYEGDTVVLNCSSSGGNPPPNITWYRGGQPVTSIASLLRPSNKFGTTTSLLTWTLSKDDHLMSFSCSVENNDLTNSRVNTTLQLNVKYPPVINVGQFNPLVAVANTSASMTCTADANPPVDPTTGISWMRNNDVLVSGSRLRIESVQLSDAGLYTCVARNYANKSALLTLEVQYPPVVTITTTAGNLSRDSVAVITEGSDLTLKCSADSNPPIDPAQLRWYRGGDQAVLHTGAELQLKAVKRTDDDVIYRCEAEAILEPSTGSSISAREQAYVKLEVHYIPGPAKIYLSTDQVVLGSQVTLWCNTSDPGNPPAVMQWTERGSRGVAVNDSLLVLPAVALTDSGNYTCRAINTVGQGARDTRWMDVLEPPRLLSATNITAERKVGDTIQALVCTVRGKPAPEVTWYKDGIPINSTDQRWYTITRDQQPLETYSWSVKSTLTFTGSIRELENSIQRQDSGNFSCQVNSVVGQPLMVQVLSLQVRYAPVLSSSELPVAVDIGRSVSLPCTAAANPEPTFTWKKDGVLLTSEGRFRMSEVVRVDGKDSFVSNMNISEVSKVDIESAYSCQVVNSIGSSTMTFNLTLRTVPAAPRDLKVVSSTWESAQLTWTPGFDGGYTQTFKIICLNRNNEFNKNYSLTSEQRNSANISGLYPGQQYQCSVHAVNQLGTSNNSNIATFLTTEFQLPLIESVQYDSKNRNLTFKALTSYSAEEMCLRSYLVYQGATEVQASPDCQPVTAGERVWWSTVGGVDGSREVKGVDASLCLRRRDDVCSGQQTAAFLSGHDVPVKTIVIAACVCGGVVLILSVILIALCCRRYYNRKYLKQSSSTTITLQPVLSQEHGSGASTPKHPPVNGFDNPAVVGYDNYINDKLNLTRHSYGQYPPTAPKDVYILERDSSLDDHVMSNGGGGSTSSHNVDGSSDSSDSGVSTNEAQKTKRIIYEIVV